MLCNFRQTKTGPKNTFVTMINMPRHIPNITESSENCTN
uniref:Uncharacterized protein n=1 Tax=Anguilla anguilla TaxID=7936 RepID=A0A0E9RWQ9_ANGAN